MGLKAIHKDPQVVNFKVKLFLPLQGIAVHWLLLLLIIC